MKPYDPSLFGDTFETKMKPYDPSLFETAESQFETTSEVPIVAPKRAISGQIGASRFSSGAGATGTWEPQTLAERVGTIAATPPLLPTPYTPQTGRVGKIGPTPLSLWERMRAFVGERAPAEKASVGGFAENLAKGLPLLSPTVIASDLAHQASKEGIPQTVQNLAEGIYGLAEPFGATLASPFRAVQKGSTEPIVTALGDLGKQVYEQPIESLLIPFGAVKGSRALFKKRGTKKVGVQVEEPFQERPMPKTEMTEAELMREFEDVKPAETPPPEVPPTPPSPPSPAPEIPAAKEIIGRGKFKPSSDVVEIPTTEIKTSPDVFQFRQEVGTEGVTEYLKGQKFNRPQSDVLTVWQSPEGEVFMLDGHNRLGVAKVSGEPTVRAQFANDFGVKTPEQARLWGALKNAPNEQTSAIDIAAAIRRSKGIDLGEFQKQFGVSLNRRSPKTKTALDLTKAGEPLWIAVVNNAVSPETGAAIARGFDALGQELALKSAAKFKNRLGRDPLPGELQSMMDDIRAFRDQKGAVSTETEGLFGEIETSLPIVERAAITSAIENALELKSQTLKGAAKETRADILKQEGVGELDTAKAATAGVKAKSDLELFRQEKRLAGNITGAINKYAIQMRDNPLEFEALKQRAMTEVTGALADLLKPKKTGGGTVSSMLKRGRKGKQGGAIHLPQFLQNFLFPPPANPATIQTTMPPAQSIFQNMKGAYEQARGITNEARELRKKATQTIDIMANMVDRPWPIIRDFKKAGYDFESLATIMEPYQRAKFSDNIITNMIEDFSAKAESLLNKTLGDRWPDKQDFVDFMGMYAQNRRIALDPGRVKFDNFQKFKIQGPSEAAKNLMDMQMQDPISFKAAEQLFDLMHEARQKNLIPELEKTGAFSSQLMDYIRSNTDWAPEIVLKYLEKKGVSDGGGIFKSTGSDLPTANPIDFMIGKDAGLLKWAWNQRAKWNAVEGYIKDPTLASNISLTQKPGWEPINYVARGNSRTVFAEPSLAKAINTNPLPLTEAALPLINFMRGKTNNPLWSIPGRFNNWVRWSRTHNPSFIAWNSLWKDPMNITKDIPDLKSMALYPVYFLTTVAKDMPHMKRAYREMRENYLLNEYRLNPEKESFFGSELQQYGASPKVTEFLGIEKEPILTRAKEVWEDAAKAADTTPKFALKKYLDSPRGAKFGQQERAQMVREMGTPNIKLGGEFSQIFNEVFQFANSNIQAWARTVKSFQRDPVAGLIKHIAMPTAMAALQYRARQGDLDGIFPNLSLQYKKQGSHIVNNYITLPGRTEKSGQSTMITLPMDHATTLVFNATTSLLDTFDNEVDALAIARKLSEAIARGYSEAPVSPTPMFEAAIDTIYYATDTPNIDWFTKRPQVPENITAANEGFINWISGGKGRGAKAFGKYMLNQYFTSGMWKSYTEMNPPAEGIVGFLSQAPITQRMIRTSAQGDQEAIGKILEEEKTTLTREQLDVKDAAAKFARGEPGEVNEWIAIGKHIDSFINWFKKYKLALGDSEARFLNTIQNVPDLETKVKLFKEFKERFPKSQERINQYIEGDSQ